MVYTPKQRALMGKWQRDELKRINLIEGSVSSGKTWISLVLWAFWVSTMPQDGLYMMCAKSLTTLKRNCLLLLQELVGESNFRFSITSKEGYLKVQTTAGLRQRYEVSHYKALIAMS